MDRKTELELLEDTSVEDLIEPIQPLAELIGLENLLKISHYTNGTEIYIPPPAALLKKARNRKIKEEYNGYNTKELSKKYSVTEEHIKRIIRGYNPQQMDIFECFDENGNLRKSSKNSE